MTPEQMKELLPVAAAYADRKVVQWKNPGSELTWYDYKNGFDPAYIDFLDPYFHWRIKPEPPKPREYWLCPRCLDVRAYQYACPGIPSFEHTKASNILVREVLPGAT